MRKPATRNPKRVPVKRRRKKQRQLNEDDLEVISSGAGAAETKGQTSK